MSRLEEDDKILLVQLYHTNSESVVEALKKFATLKGIKNKKHLPHPSTVTNLIQKFHSNGTVSNSVPLVTAIFRSDNLLRRQEQTSKSLLHNVLRKELKLYPYKASISNKELTSAIGQSTN